MSKLKWVSFPRECRWLQLTISSREGLSAPLMVCSIDCCTELALKRSCFVILNIIYSDVTNIFQNVPTSSIYLNKIKLWRILKVQAMIIKNKNQAFILSLCSQLYKSMVIIALLLLGTVIGQNCPYCQWDSCSITQTGFANCSACTYGALSTMEVYSPTQGAEYPQIVGVCQPCPVGCSSCQFAVLSPAMSQSFLAMNCTQCEPQYAYAFAYGGCVACPANCLTCETGGDLSNYVLCTDCSSGFGVNFTAQMPVASSCYACPMNCLSCECINGQAPCAAFTCTLCASGYTLNASNSNLTTCYASSTVQLQTSTEDSSSTSGAVIGLSIWGALMSVLAIIFLVLYFKQRQDVAKPTALLSNNGQTRQVSF